ncbi:hypothetical protein Rhow_007666 [Rhodococcus wratislaviensis]|uniref:Uncharacterized protein n=1 Tax=Rhodococcus wratislaviensis TaxID=44752 RepID=A0A402CII5_RHOWR|nr:hypothetical protein Rhow_007666 [Rhodococcus wratislaviensis]
MDATHRFNVAIEYIRSPAPERLAAFSLTYSATTSGSAGIIEIPRSAHQLANLTQSCR